MNRARIILISLYSLVAVFAIIQITASNFLATDGVNLAQIQNNISRIKKENMVLSEKVYTLSSLTEVASSAAMLGFIPEKDTLFLNTPLPVAMNP